MNILRNRNFLAMAALMAEGVGSSPAAAPQTETKVIHKQNGIKRPESDSLTGKLWDIADELSKKAGSPALRKDVVDAYVKAVPGANLATAHTQYARWVTYHGATDALAAARAKAKADKAAEADKLKAEAKAKKDADKKAKDEAKAKKDAEKAEAKAKADAEKVAAAEKKAADKAKADAEKKAAAEKEKAEAAKAAAKPAAKASPAAAKK